jgi:hypothetical protein
LLLLESDLRGERVGADDGRRFALWAVGCSNRDAAVLTAGSGSARDADEAVDLRGERTSPKLKAPDAIAACIMLAGLIGTGGMLSSAELSCIAGIVSAGFGAGAAAVTVSSADGTGVAAGATPDTSSSTRDPSFSCSLVQPSAYLARITPSLFTRRSSTTMQEFFARTPAFGEFMSQPSRTNDLRNTLYSAVDAAELPAFAWAAGYCFFWGILGGEVDELPPPPAALTLALAGGILGGDVLLALEGCLARGGPVLVTAPVSATPSPPLAPAGIFLLYMNIGWAPGHFVVVKTAAHFVQ